MDLTELTLEQWGQAWHALPPPCREVYYHPAYVLACGAWEGATAHCLLVRDGIDRWMLHAYLAHPIAGTNDHDVQTAYGYGGPLFVGDWTTDGRAAALRTVARHLCACGAIAEFIRCHTEWDDLSALREAGMTVFEVRTNVECDLSREDFTTAWSSGARRNLRKAASAGLSWRPGATGDDWGTFESLYARTAKRLDMAPPYRFNSAYFARLSKVECARLLLVEGNGRTVAGAILFLGGRLAHYHLGASDFEQQHLRPNDYLYSAMASCARQANCQRIVWGGGLSNDPQDTLFRFKAHFGAGRRSVHCAGRVLDRTRYEQLCRQWEDRNPGRISKLFLRYRA